MERLIAWYRLSSSVGAVVALVLANALPLIGVLFLGWSVWNILIVYWLENGIVGVFNVLKMSRAEGVPGGEQTNWSINGRPAATVGRAAMIPFFVMHYGIFWAVHGVFVLTFPVFGGLGGAVDLTDGVSPAWIAFAALALTVSHGISYWFNFIGRGEYRRVSAATQMFAPYGRLIVLHMTIILGGIAISFLGAPAAAIAILVIFKIVMDLGFHLAEHRRGSPAAGTTTPT